MCEGGGGAEGSINGEGLSWRLEREGLAPAWWCSSMQSLHEVAAIKTPRAATPRASAGAAGAEEEPGAPGGTGAPIGLGSPSMGFGDGGTGEPVAASLAWAAATAGVSGRPGVESMPLARESLRSRWRLFWNQTWTWRADTLSFRDSSRRVSRPAQAGKGTA